MSKNLVRIPAKNLNDLMVKARENGAVGITAYPDNHVKNSGESWAWGYLTHITGSAAYMGNSWPLYIRSDLVSCSWLTKGNSSIGERILLKSKGESLYSSY